jgi:amidase
MGLMQHCSELFSRTGEPIVPSLEAVGLMSVEGTTLKGFFDLNVSREEAARQYLRLFCDNSIDAILMPVAPHTALPWDKWASATYTGIWNYLDYPAIAIPVDKVRGIDLADDIGQAKHGPEDVKTYELCMYKPLRC